MRTKKSADISEKKHTTAHVSREAEDDSRGWGWKVRLSQHSTCTTPLRALPMEQQQCNIIAAHTTTELSRMRTTRWEKRESRLCRPPFFSTTNPVQLIFLERLSREFIGPGENTAREIFRFHCTFQRCAVLTRRINRFLFIFTILSLCDSVISSRYSRICRKMSKAKRDIAEKQTTPLEISEKWKQSLIFPS